MQRMNRNLPNDIDKFFSDRLGNYSEEPANEIWSEIDKKLTEKERNKAAWSWCAIISASAIIVIGFLLPYFLGELSFHQQDSIRRSPIEQIKNSAGNKNYSSYKPTKNVSDNSAITKKV